MWRWILFANSFQLECVRRKEEWGASINWDEKRLIIFAISPFLIAVHATHFFALKWRDLNDFLFDDDAVVARRIQECDYSFNFLSITFQILISFATLKKKRRRLFWFALRARSSPALVFRSHYLPLYVYLCPFLSTPCHVIEIRKMGLLLSTRDYVFIRWTWPKSYVFFMKPLSHAYKSLYSNDNNFARQRTNDVRKITASRRKTKASEKHDSWDVVFLARRRCAPLFFLFLSFIRSGWFLQIPNRNAYARSSSVCTQWDRR